MPSRRPFSELSAPGRRWAMTDRQKDTVVLVLDIIYVIVSVLAVIGCTLFI